LVVEAEWVVVSTRKIPAHSFEAMVEQVVAEGFSEFKVYYLLSHPIVQLSLVQAVLWVRKIHPMLVSLPTEETVEYPHSITLPAKPLAVRVVRGYSQTL
jgi:uncharacterized membrane protein